MASYTELRPLSPISPSPAALPTVSTSQRIVTIVCCSLSIVGSLLIILSFCITKDLRNRIRSFVVFISLMDITYSTANLVGASINFDRYMNRTSDGYHVFSPPNVVLDVLCKVQGSLAVYGTLGSILWTSCMAMYVYFNVICHLKGKYSKMLFGIYWCGHAFCWLVPLYIMIWALVDDDVTYSPLLSFGGWCTAFGKKDFSWRGIKFATLLFNDYWMFSSFILILVFCLATSVVIWAEKRTTMSAPVQIPLRLDASFKLIAIPLVFVLLRCWSMLIGYIYVVPYSYPHMPLTFLQYLSAIGDSSQGFFNFILYCILTKKFRSTLLRRPVEALQKSIQKSNTL